MGRVGMMWDDYLDGSLALIQTAVQALKVQ
jgi:hypothetical protein